MEGEDEEEEGDREEEGTDPDMYPSDTALSGDGCCTTTVGIAVLEEEGEAVPAIVVAVVVLFSIRLIDAVVVMLLSL